MAGALATIALQCLTGREWCLLQAQNDDDDVCDLTHVSDRVKLPERLVGLAAIGILTMPGDTAFSRISRRTYSIASDQVAASKPPLVSDASTEGTALSMLQNSGN
jgi:hypothetical protein